MLNKINKSLLLTSASFMVGMMYAESAFASGNNFNSIASKIVGSISSFPTLISAISYLFGMLLMVLGVLKIKEHVEQPTQIHLKDGAIRLAAGGGLFALPIISEAALETIGNGTSVSQSSLNSMSF
jgi:hypothetical protein